MSTFALKIILLFFWSLWFTIVLATNVCAGLKAIGVLPEGWKFSSGNFTAISQATSKYTVPGWLPGVLFSGVVLWQAAATFFFWLALARSVPAGAIDFGITNVAFALALGLWLAFQVADEVFQVYESESGHGLIFVEQMATLLGLYLLP